MAVNYLTPTSRSAPGGMARGRGAKSTGLFAACRISLIPVDRALVPLDVDLLGRTKIVVERAEGLLVGIGLAVLLQHGEHLGLIELAHVDMLGVRLHERDVRGAD